jgi:hypothetical protein
MINVVRGVLERGPMPESFTRLYWVFLALKLCSLAIECRKRKLHGVLPLTTEVVREFDQIRLSLLGTRVTAILHSVTPHFAAHMEVSAFNYAITTWALTGHGRMTIRADEAHFMTQVNL